MKISILLLLVALAAAGFLGYPLLGEDTGSECDAFERLAVRLSLGAEPGQKAGPDLLLGQFFQGFSKGQLARAAARNQYPNAPVSVACAILYWKAVRDPGSIRQAVTGLH